VSTLTIRSATKEDLPAIKELWKEFMDFHKERDPFFSRVDNAHEDFGQFMRSNLDKNDWLVLVTTTDDQVIAYGAATIMSYPPIYQDPRYGYIQDVAVTEAYRGQGIGHQIFEKMVAWFREKDVSRLELEVAVTNELSQAFWQKVGFTDFSKKLSMNL
jgi:ribosomal protein S18 acetylase RimI-like enzyme